MEQVALGLGHKAQVLVFPNYTMISFDREEYPALGSQTLCFSTTSGLDMYKLHLVDELARRVASYASPLPPRGSKLPPNLSEITSVTGLAEGDLPSLFGSVRPSRNIHGRSRFSSVARAATMFSMSGALDRAAGGIRSDAPRGGDLLQGSKANKHRTKSLQRILEGRSNGTQDRMAESPTGDDGAEGSASSHSNNQTESNDRDLEAGRQGRRESDDSSSSGDDDDDSIQDNIKRWILNLASYGPGFFSNHHPSKSPSVTVNVKGGINAPMDASAYVINDDPSQPLLQNKELDKVASAAAKKASVSASAVGAIGAAVAAASSGAIGKVEKNDDPAARAQAAAFEYIAVEDATKRLKQIVALPDLYPGWSQHMMAGIAAGGTCGLFFKGGWADVGVSVVLGAWAGWLGDACEGQHTLDKIYEFLGAFVIAASIRAMIHYGVPLCYAATTLSSIINLVQGVTITLAMVELATRNLISGTTRLAYGLTMTGIIGYGLDLGATMTSRILKISKLPDQPECSYPLDPKWYAALFVPTVMCYCLTLNAHVRQLPSMLLTGTIAFLVSYFTEDLVGANLSSALAAFTMGVASNLHSRWTGAPAIVGDMAGLNVLVPGALAVRGVGLLFDGTDVTGGLGLVASVLIVALSLGIGLFMAGIVVSIPVEQGRSGEREGGRGRRVVKGNLAALHF
ncbi:hypothetical protein HDV00_001891 [Rhizophlyctis rosea]|nr:hypothetical protein HDV00_001891 [Rhizophlyctis rosea]